MTMRCRHVTLAQACAGMVLHSSVSIFFHGIKRCFFPANHRLTEGNLKQLATHRIEFLVISEIETRSPEEILSDTAEATGRVKTIFAGADLAEPTMAALYTQVLAFRSAF